MMLARVCVALGAFAACHRGEPPAEIKRPPEARATVVPPKIEPPMAAPTPEAPPQPKAEALPACLGMGAFSLGLTGLSQDRVSKRLGPPSEREAYLAGKRGGEFYSRLKDLYPSKVPSNREVPIEEWTWTSGECVLTVLFHRVNGEWTSLDDIYRHKDVAF
jgi:hypothetical protein